MKTLKLAGFLMFFLGLGLFNQSFSQTTIRVFEAGDNSGQMARVTTDSDGAMIKLEYTHRSHMNWVEATIQTVQNYQYPHSTNARVKSNTSGRVYEISIDYESGRLIETTPEGKELSYWIKN